VPEPRIALGLGRPLAEHRREPVAVVAVEEQPDQPRPCRRGAGVDRQRAPVGSSRVGRPPAPLIELRTQHPVVEHAVESIVAHGAAAELGDLVPSPGVGGSVHREQEEARLVEASPAFAPVADRFPGAAGLASEDDQPLGADAIDRTVLPDRPVGALGELVGFLLPRQLGEQLPVLVLRRAGDLAPPCQLAQRGPGAPGRPRQPRELERARQAGAVALRDLGARGDRGRQIAPSLVERGEPFPCRFVRRAARGILEQRRGALRRAPALERCHQLGQRGRGERP
jgi:hypothetical protein